MGILSRFSRALHAAQIELCGTVADVGDNDTRTRASQQQIAASFGRSDYYYENVLPYGLLCDLRLAFFNYGFHLRPSKDDRQRWDLWKNERQAREVMPRIEQFVRHVWREYWLKSNAVVFWRSGSEDPMLLPLEKCRFEDTYGIQKLYYRHGLSTQQINELFADDALAKQRYLSQSELELSDENQEYFQVIKDSMIGTGFGLSRHWKIFPNCDLFQSIEAGDNTLGQASRRVVTHHKVGHEIKQGPYAGMATHFLSKTRRQAIEDQFRGKSSGVVEAVTNFDHEVGHTYVDPKAFDSKKYDGVLNKFKLWSMPVYNIIESSSQVSQTMLQLFMTEATERREIIRPALEKAINEVYRIPKAFGYIKVHWSNRCFRDARTISELVKFALSTGPLSSQTFLEDLGYDPYEERRRKDIESKLPPEQIMPRWDASHGIDPVGDRGPNGPKTSKGPKSKGKPKPDEGSFGGQGGRPANGSGA